MGRVPRRSVHGDTDRRNAARPFPAARERKLVQAMEMSVKRMVLTDDAGAGAAERRTGLCRSRGFHGPFRVDAGAGGDRDAAVCTVCGSSISMAEHQAAYEIARFHGLTP